MENLWSQKEAEELVKYYRGQGVGRDIAMRVYSSRLLGGVSDLVLHGGGNVSVKTQEKNLLGQTVEVLRVKGSGWNMDTIEPEGLPAVRLKPLQDSIALDSLSDFDMVNLHRTSLVDSSAPNPSVETLLHAFLPHKFVDHTHSNAILALTDQVNGAQMCEEIFGSRAGLVPYIMPGFRLAKSALDVFRASPNSEGLILLKHGIFTFGETAEESYNRMIELVTLAESNIPDSAVSDVKPISDSVPSHDIGPVIRGKCVVSDREDGEARPFVVSFRTSPAIRSYRLNSFTKDNFSLKMLTTSQKTLKNRGKKIIEYQSKKQIKQLGINLEPSNVEAGSGSLPDDKIESMALAFRPRVMKVYDLAKLLRCGSIPVIGYMSGNTYYIDLKAVLPNQIIKLAKAIKEI